MKITMRLYRIHDLDLLYLYKTPDFSIQKAIKQALSAYLSNEELIIKYPKATDVVLPRSAMIHIYLSDKKDAEVISWLKNISKGYRNSLLKNIVRNYLESPSVDPYLMDSDVQMYGGVLPKDNKSLENKSNIITNENKNDEVKTKEVEIKEENIPKQQNEKEEQTTNEDSFDLFSAFDDVMSSF